MITNRKKFNESCILYYMDSSIPLRIIGEFIMSTYKSVDIYLYIHKSVNIDPVKFSTIFPIKGYIYGNLPEVPGYLSLINYIDNLDFKYIMKILPGNIDILSNHISFYDLYIQYMKKGIKSSIFKSNEMDIDDSLSKVHKDNILKRFINFIINKNINYGINETNYSNSIIILSKDDKFKLDEHKDYISTFNKSTITSFIPSYFNKFDIKFLNMNPMNLLPSQEALKP